jgi:hypothetical protein
MKGCRFPPDGVLRKMAPASDLWIETDSLLEFSVEATVEFPSKLRLEVHAAQ